MEHGSKSLVKENITMASLIQGQAELNDQMAEIAMRLEGCLTCVVGPREEKLAESVEKGEPYTLLDKLSYNNNTSSVLIDKLGRIANVLTSALG